MDVNAKCSLWQHFNILTGFDPPWQIQEEISEFKRQGSAMEDQRVAILKSLEEKQTEAAKDADTSDAKLKSVNKILDQLKAGKKRQMSSATGLCLALKSSQHKKMFA